MKKVIICNNFRSNPNQPSCSARGSQAITEAITDAINTHHLSLEIEHIKCLGKCADGPNVKLVPYGPFIQGVDSAQLPSLIKKIQDFVKKPINK